MSFGLMLYADCGSTGTPPIPVSMAAIKSILRIFIYTFFALCCAFPNSSADVTANRYVDSDKDCVFGCDASWETYTCQKIEMNRFGYHPKGGDIIAWKIKTIDRLKSTRLNGIGYYSEIMPILDVTILINGVEQSLLTPSCYKAICTIELAYPVNLSIGDTIQVEVKSVVEDGFINSIQTSVVH